MSFKIEDIEKYSRSERFILVVIQRFWICPEIVCYSIAISLFFSLSLVQLIAFAIFNKSARSVFFA